MSVVEPPHELSHALDRLAQHVLATDDHGRTALADMYTIVEAAEDELGWLRQLRDLAAVHTKSVEGGDMVVCSKSDTEMMALLADHGFHEQDFARMLTSFLGGLG